MTDFSQLFLYVPGILIFLVGSGRTRDFLKKRKLGSCMEATVLSCNHIQKKNKLDQITYDYYSIMVEYLDSRSGKKKKETLKSPVSYYEGQPVRLFRRDAGQEPVLIQQEEETMFHPFAVMIGGAVLILLAFYQLAGRPIPAMICLSAFLSGCGICMIWSWYHLRKRNLETIDAEITDVYKRQLSKESKILKGNKFTYYPIVSYEINGIRNSRRCNMNSGDEKTYQIGNHLTLYYDASHMSVMEQNAHPIRLFWGILILLIGLAAGLSIFSVIL